VNERESTRTMRITGRHEIVAFRKYRLQVSERSEAGELVEPAQQVDVERQHATIGSAPGNDLVLTDPTVSRAHCEIAVDEHGYLLRDLGSKNGTFVDGNRVLAGYLKPGSVINAGDARIVFTPAGEDVQITLTATTRWGKLIGPSLEMRALFAVLEKVAAQDVTTLIEGESGTGKELVAAEIHAHSRRKDEPFVVFDCSAVAENLVESELFGHVKGAFTGAVSDRLGAVRTAAGGSLFLDEIGELPLELQPKLLRALESKEVRPVGSTKSEIVDVRVIAATNRDLTEEVAKGAFRKDLFFRLDVMRVRVPPLRHRLEDIPELVGDLVKARAAKEKTELEIPPDVLAMLKTYSWPGNVRELKNFVERYLVMAPETAGAAVELLETGRPKGKGSPASSLMRFDLPYKDAKAKLLDAFEAQYCKRWLEKNKGNISAAAREAGIHRKHFEELVKKHSLKETDPKEG
jgi:two-component system response regulator GlrR